jgi:hypothetical protein
MSASDVTQKRRLAALIRGPRLPQSYDDHMGSIVGFAEGLCCVNESVMIQQIVRAGLTSVLDYIAANNKGPTNGSRLLYMWFYGIRSAYRWSEGQRSLSLTHVERCTWMLHSATHVTRQIGASTEALESQLREDDGWDTIQQKGDWASWLLTWETWFAQRTNDGSVAANQPPTDLPNGTHVLNVSEVTAFTDFPEPDKWAPLKIDGTTQRYLSHGWGDITAALITPEQELDILAAAGAPLSGDARKDELEALLVDLTDRQKVIAEFWAGGKNTYAPPGMLMYLWKEFTESANISAYRMVHSGYELAARLFETGRLVWYLKRQFMEARPIQSIRQLPEQQLWKPYQPPDFVTPPFADFPSGHSAFSQSFAHVMTKWFGPTIPVLPARNMTGLSLFCPALGNEQTQRFGTFLVPVGSSDIEPAVPREPVELSWDTWQEMADEAGISRQYGGIHAASAHEASQRVANKLDELIGQESP